MALEPSSKAVFSQFRDTRKYTIRHRDVDGQVFYETRQDCEPIAEFVKAFKDAPPPRDRDLTLLGEIPMSIIGEWMRDGSLDDEKHVRRWLNQNPAFRTYKGTV